MKRSKHRSNASKKQKQQKLSFVPAPHPISSVGEAIKCLAGEKNSGAGKERITHSLLIVENASAADSLSFADIIALVDIIGSQNINLQITSKLMKCLFMQKQNVLEDCIINAVSWICTWGLHSKVQADLLRWVLHAYDTIEQKQNFSYLYGIIFSFMEYETLVPFACELLCKMTEKHHVVPFRVRHLLEILSRSGAQLQLHILALLGVFSQYRQDLLTIQLKAKSFFRSLGALPPSIEKQHADRHLEKKSLRKKEIGFTEMMIDEEMKSFTQLYEAAQNLNKPKGLYKLLTSSKRRILFTSGLPTTVLSQFSLWLRHSLAAEKPLKQNALSAERRDLLILASDISEELQEGIPEVEGFVKAYLARWNGHSHLNVLLDVIQYWKFCTFENLLEDVLLPIFKCFRASSVSYKCSVLECYTKLYQRWVLWEVQRHEACRNRMDSTNPGYQQMTVFEQELKSEDPYHEVQSLASYIDSMCTVALQLHPDHPPILLYQILKFFEVVIHAHSLNCAAPLVLPSPFIMCAAVFASSAAAVSQLCSLIISYKKAMDDVRTNNAEVIQQSVISTLNGCLLDICNVLWRCRAFQPHKGSLLFYKELPLHIRQSIPAAHASFSLYHHPAFYSLALDFVHKSQVTLPELLSDEAIRDAYLAHLSDSGLESIISFMHIFIRALTSRGDITRKSE